MLAATIAALPSSTIAADDELAGTYRLISSTRTILETGEVLDTWGKNPNGFIIYGKDGRMLVLIVRRDRPKPESVDKITDQQRADLHRSMTAYGGRTSSMASGFNTTSISPGTRYSPARR
jgi:Lipocalin-like domain